MTNKRAENIKRYVESVVAMTVVVAAGLFAGAALGSRVAVSDSAPLASQTKMTQLDLVSSTIGDLLITNSLALQPRTQSATAKAGQVYFDKDTRALVYYDGTNFQTVVTGQQFVDLKNELIALRTTSSTETAVATTNSSSTVANPGDFIQNGTTAQTANFNITGNAVAATFSGNGAALSSLSANNFSAGTLSDARLSTNVTLLGNSFNGNGQLIKLDSAGAAGSAGLCLLSTASGSTFQACPSGSGSGNISSGTSQTAGKLVKFDSTSNQITDSILSESGTTVTVGGTLAATALTGGGSGVTSLNASNLSTGTVADGRLSSNVTLLGNSFNGSSQLVQLTAGGLLPVLNGANLTGLNASNLSSGTLADARLSTAVTVQGNSFNGVSQLVQTTGAGALPIISGVNLTNLNGTNIASGTVADARLSSNVTLQGNVFNGVSQLVQTTTGGILPVISGVNLTSLNASSLSSGTVADGRLSTNVALQNAANVFSGSVNLTGGLQLSGAAASGSFLRGNGTSFVATGIQAADIPSGSANYIHNSTSQQTSSNFNISGNGVIGGSLMVAPLANCTGITTSAAGLLSCNTGLLDNISRIQVHGHSYTTAGNSTGANPAFNNYTNRLAGMLHANLNNQGKGGAIAAWHNSGGTGDGGYFKVLQDITAYKSSAPYTAQFPLGILHYGMNDFAALGSSNFDAPFKNAMRTMISRYRAASVYEAETGGNGSGTLTYGGIGGPHWSTYNVSNLNLASGTGYVTTSTASDTYTINVPSDFPGGTVAVGMIFNAANNATHTWTVDGAAAGSFSGTGQYATGKTLVATKRFTNLSAGAHTITGTVSGLTGQALIDYWQIEANPAPTVILPLANRFYNYDIYTGWTQMPTDADVPTINTALTEVAGEFDNSVITVETDSTINKDQKYFMADNVHLNELGNAKFTELMYRAIKDAPIPIANVTVGSVNAQTNNQDSVIFRNNNNSTSAFLVQGYGGPGVSNSTVFNVDTLNNRIGIGMTTPTARLDILAANDGIMLLSGSASAYTHISIGRTTTEGVIGIAGATNNFLTGSAAGDWVFKAIGGKLLLATSGTGAAASFSTDGSVTFKNTVNSVTAFQVQNAAGTANLVVADTTNSLIGVGTAPTAGGSLLQIGTNTTTNTGGLQFGSDTIANFYRYAAGFIRTDGSLVVGGGGQALTVTGGTAASSNYMTIGRTANDLFVGVVGAAGTFSNDSLQGDLAIGTAATTQALMLNTGVGSTASALSILNNNVGIGIRSASTKLDVRGSVLFKNTSNSLTAFQVQPSGSTTPVLNVDTTNSRVGVGKAAPGYTLDVTGEINATVTYRLNGTVGTTATCAAGQALNGINVRGGIVTAGTCTINAADIAESYNSTDTLVPGEIVATDPGNYPNVLRSSSVGQDNLIGVVSTNPAQTLDDGDAPNGYPVALIGRVPVKVNTEGGAIHTGDKITSSSVAGVGKKAGSAGMVIGTALEDAGNDGIVMVFVHTFYYDPTSAASMQGGQAGEFSSLNVSGMSTLSELTVTGAAHFQGDITVGGHIITAGAQPAVQAQGSNTCTVEGNDTSGKLTITAGIGDLEGAQCVLTFVKSYGAAPNAVFTARSKDSAQAGIYVDSDATTVTVYFANPPVAGTTYNFSYFIVQ